MCLPITACDRAKLAERFGMDCFFSVSRESAAPETTQGDQQIHAAERPGEEQHRQPKEGADQRLRFMLHCRDLPPPVIDAAEFVQLQLQGRQQRRRQDERPNKDSSSTPSLSDEGSWGKSVGVQALSDVIGQVLLQRPMARLAIGGPAELAFSIKALGLAADAALRSRRGGLLAFLSTPSSDDASSSPLLSPTRSGQADADAAPQAGGGTPLSFPLQLDVQRVKTVPLRRSVFGPARGHLAEGSSREGFRKALAGEVSLRGL